VFHHICGSNSRRLAPGEIHLSMDGAEGQPRFENQQHAAVKKKTRTSQANYHRQQVVMRIMLPQAEIKTAGVIIAVSTATAEDIGSTLEPQLNAGVWFSVSSRQVWLTTFRLWPP